MHKNGFMSLEALVSLTVMLFLLNFIVITINANRLDTTLYKYQLLNDIIEVSEKLDYFYTAGHDNLYQGNSVFDNMTDMANDVNYCLLIEDDYGELTNNCPNQAIEDGVSTTRILSNHDGSFSVIRFTMWKNRD